MKTATRLRRPHPATRAVARRAARVVLAGVTAAAALTAAAPATRLRAQEDVPEGRILFASDRDGDYEIYAVDTDGGRLRQITHNRVYDGAPTWHPSGDRIAYVRTRGYHSQIRVHNLRAGTSWRVVRSYEESEFEDPQYSRSGRWIAYVDVFYGVFHDLRAVRPGDGKKVLIADRDGENDLRHSYPAWSPSGHKIADITVDPIATDGDFLAVRAFGARSPGPSPPLARADVTGPSPCADWPSDSAARGLAWAPDGDTLAYGLYAGGRYHLCLEPVAGGEARSPAASDAPLVPGSWAPEGGHLAVEDGRNGTGDIAIVDVATGEVVAVTSGPASDSSPEWMVRPTDGGCRALRSHDGAGVRPDACPSS